MNILLSAYSCRPHSSSEPGIGWNWALGLAQKHTVFVLTRTKYKDQILRELESKNLPHLHFVFLEAGNVFLRHKKTTAGTLLYYYLWQIAAYFKARRICRTLPIDLVHHVTFVNSWLPSFLALLPVPFIWGPIAQHPPLPGCLLGPLPIKYRILNCFTVAFKWAFRKFDPFYHLTLRRARAILLPHEFCKNLFPQYVHPRIRIMPSIFYEKNNSYPFPLATDKTENQPVRIVTAGRLESWKGFHLVLDTFAEFNRTCPGSTLTIIGRGRLYPWLCKHIEQLGLQNCVTLVPLLPRREFFQQLSRHDLFLYPNIGMNPIVLLDANSVNLPVVCLKFPGTYEHIENQNNVMVEVAPDYSDTIKNLLRGIERALACPADHQRRISPDQLDRNRKILALQKIYQQVISPAKPV